MFKRIFATTMADLAHRFTGEPDEPCEVCEKSEADARHQLDTRQMATERVTLTRQKGV